MLRDPLPPVVSEGSQVPTPTYLWELSSRGPLPLPCWTLTFMFPSFSPRPPTRCSGKIEGKS